MRDLVSILDDLVEANASSNRRDKKKYVKEILGALSALSSEWDRAARRAKILEETEEPDLEKINDEVLRHLIQIYLRPLKQAKYSLTAYREALLSFYIPDDVGRSHNAVMEAIALLSDKPKLFSLENRWKDVKKQNKKNVDILSRKVFSLTFETERYLKHLANSIGEQLKKENLPVFHYLFSDQTREAMNDNDDTEVSVTDATITQLSKILLRLKEIEAAHEEGQFYEVSLEESDTNTDEAIIDEDTLGKGKEKVDINSDEADRAKEKSDSNKPKADQGRGNASKGDLPISVLDDAALTLSNMIEKNKILALTFRKFDSANELLGILQESQLIHTQHEDTLPAHNEHPLVAVLSSKASINSKKSSDEIHTISSNQSEDVNLDITDKERSVLEEKYEKSEKETQDKIELLKAKLTRFNDTLDKNKQIISANRDKFGMIFLKNAAVILAFVGTLSLSHFLWNDFGIKDSQGNKFAKKSENIIFPKSKK